MLIHTLGVRRDLPPGWVSCLLGADSWVVGLGTHPVHLEFLAPSRSAISLESPGGVFDLPAEHLCQPVLWSEGARVTGPSPSPTTVTAVLGSAPHLPMTCSPWREQALCFAHLASSRVAPPPGSIPCTSSGTWDVSQDSLGTSVTQRPFN